MNAKEARDKLAVRVAEVGECKLDDAMNKIEDAIDSGHSRCVISFLSPEVAGYVAVGLKDLGFGVEVSGMADRFDECEVLIKV